MDYILDTNIVVIYVRANKAARNLEKDLELFAQQNNLVISAVTVGEVRSLALQNKWGDRKVERLNRLFRKIFDRRHQC